MKKGKKTALIAISAVSALALIFVSAFFIMTAIGKHQFHKDDTNISTPTVEIEDENTITYNDKKYILNKDIVSILVMGIDRSDIEKNLGSGNNGQADVIFVATMDTKTKKACIIPLSRETMTDINLYTEDGKYIGTQNEQLCLAYAYGTDTQKCSENVMTSVKRLLCGININSYITFEMEAVSELTDMIGGVQLTSLEDFSSGTLNAVKGQTVTLKGKSAINYIQYRGDDLEANARRMQRQKQFLSALINKTGNAVLSDFSNLATYYNGLSPYFSTNVSFAQTTYLAQNCLSLNLGDSIDYKTIEGTLSMGEKWVEFRPYDESLLQTVIDVFYVPCE